MFKKNLARLFVFVGTGMTFLSSLTILSVFNQWLETPVPGWLFIPGILMLVVGFRGIHFTFPEVIEEKARLQKQRRLAAVESANKVYGVGSSH